MIEIITRVNGNVDHSARFASVSAARKALARRIDNEAHDLIVSGHRYSYVERGNMVLTEIVY